MTANTTNEKTPPAITRALDLSDNNSRKGSATTARSPMFFANHSQQQKPCKEANERLEG